MAPTCRICGVFYPATRQSHASEERCKPCQAYFDSHNSTERPWFFWDTADAIARDLLPQFHSYARENSLENPSVKPHQAGKRCQAGCGNLGLSKNKSSHCKSCKENHRKVGFTLPRTWLWMQQWSKAHDLAELATRAALLRSPYRGDPNQFYDLNRDASEQGYAYYHVGYKEAHGPSAIDVSTNDRQQSPRELRPRAKKPAAVPDEQTDPATKPSDDDSDCLIVGVSVYGRESGKKPAASTKRKRAQPESGDGSDFEPSEHMSDTSESQTSPNPSRSCASVSATANSSTTSAGSLSFGGKPKASSDLPTRVIINPTLSFVTANGKTVDGHVREVMDEMLPGIQQAIATYTQGAIAQHTKPDRGMESVAAMTEPTLCDKSVQTEISTTDAVVQAEVQITDMAVQTESKYDAAMQTLPSKSASIKRKFSSSSSTKVYRHQTARLRRCDDGESEDELNDSTLPTF